MIRKSPLQEKTFDFAIEIVHFCKILKLRKEYVLADQLLRSGTSIGANIAEAYRAQSRRDFLAKISIAHKEAGETDFWLRLIIASDIANNEPKSFLLKIDEILRMLCATIKTLKSREHISQ